MMEDALVAVSLYYFPLALKKDRVIFLQIDDKVMKDWMEAFFFLSEDCIFTLCLPVGSPSADIYAFCSYV